MRDIPSSPAPFSRRALRIVLAALAVALAPSLCAAQTRDVVVTTNGDRLTGEVKGLVRGRLDFKTDATSTIQIRWDHVALLTSANFFEVVLEGGRRRFGALLEPETDGVLRVGLDTVYEDVPLDDVATIERLRQSFWDRLKGKIDVGLSFSRADARKELNLTAETRYRTQKWRFAVSAESLFRRQDSGADFDRDSFGTTAQRFFGGRWLGLAFTSVQRNTELAIDRRFLAVAGGGFHVLRTVEHDLIFAAGLAGSSERFLDDRNPTESLEAMIAVYYTLFALGGNDFTADAIAIAYPSLSVGGRFRSELSLDVRKEVVKDVYLSVRGVYSTDNSSEDTDTSRTDYNVTAAVGWSF